MEIQQAITTLSMCSKFKLMAEWKIIKWEAIIPNTFSIIRPALDNSFFFQNLIRVKRLKKIGV